MESKSVAKFIVTIVAHLLKYASVNLSEDTKYKLVVMLYHTSKSYKAIK